MTWNDVIWHIMTWHDRTKMVNFFSKDCTSKIWCHRLDLKYRRCIFLSEHRGRTESQDKVSPVLVVQEAEKRFQNRQQCGPKLLCNSADILPQKCQGGCHIRVRAEVFWAETWRSAFGLETVLIVSCGDGDDCQGTDCVAWSLTLRPRT